MIWIIGEYAERIDNAAELLESFLEGFQDENSQVCIFIEKHARDFLIFKLIQFRRHHPTISTISIDFFLTYRFSYSY